MRYRFACVALAVLLACGGSSPGGGTTAPPPPPPPPPCTPITGVWHLTDTLNSTSSGFCAAALATGAATVVLASTGANTFTWTETDSLVGTVVINGIGNINGACAANITLSLSGTINEPTFQVTLLAGRSVAFQNNTMGGTTQVTLSTTPVQAGTPCTGLYTTSGTR